MRFFFAEADATESLRKVLSNTVSLHVEIWLAAKRVASVNGVMS
ncbi:hypothetical protein SAMN05443244_0982 [Terriglobus roseus]|uniref:Uncharacterized protein n=1 Tax=Terriglobus roseus TaxID=392734 RepID=A0A1H4K347_9BACT|nr:hypothetical protein SAMN05443244_0982 [Terriglobus roseus]